MAPLPIEKKLWEAADKLRKNINAAECRGHAYASSRTHKKMFTLTRIAAEADLRVSQNNKEKRATYP